MLFVKNKIFSLCLTHLNCQKKLRFRNANYVATKIDKIMINSGHTHSLVPMCRDGDAKRLGTICVVFGDQGINKNKSLFLEWQPAASPLTWSNLAI